MLTKIRSLIATLTQRQVDPDDKGFAEDDALYGGASAAPIRIIIGTCPGSKKDTVALVEALVERYFDIPSEAWYAIRPAGPAGFHYEIHESGVGRGYIDDIIKKLASGYDEIVLKGLIDRRLRVALKDDGALMTVLVPDNDHAPEMTDDLNAKTRMNVLQDRLNSLVVYASLVFVAGLISIGVASAVNKVVDLESRGYYEAANNIPISRLADLKTDPANLNALSGIPDQTVLDYWDRVREVDADPTQYISAIRYEQGNWSINVVDRPVEDEGNTSGQDQQNGESGQ